jgi:O-antigen ligase
VFLIVQKCKTGEWLNNIYVKEIGNSYREKKSVYFLACLIALILPVFSCAMRFEVNEAFILLGVAVLSAAIYNINLMIFVLAISMFLGNDFLYLKFAVWGGVPLIVSFLINFKEISFSQLKNPLWAPVGVYLLSILPSYYNCSNKGLSFALTTNLLMMIIVFTIIGYSAKNYSTINKHLYGLLAVGLANGLYLIVLAVITGARLYGFQGVAYVDFSLIMTLISSFMASFSLGYKKILYLILALIFFIAFLLTQTRNPLIPFALTLLVLVIFIYLKNNYLNIARKKVLIGVFASIIILATVFFGISAIAPQAFNRLNEMQTKSQVEVQSEASFDANSLITRFMIWHTCYNSFLQHPIIGIGAYSFPFESARYNKLPNMIFKLFVNGKSPHETFFAVLTETGILGFGGFLYFLFSILKLSIASFRLSGLRDQRYYSLMLMFLTIYIMFSMFMTDAWLYGQCGMLWGYILGLLIANHNIIIKYNKN